MKATFARKNSPDIKNEDNHDGSTSKTNELPNRIFSYPTSRLDGSRRKASPRIQVPPYDRVVIDLTTHDAGGISQKDVDLAKRLEEIASKLA
jgi:hypothetical protein